MTFLQLIEIQHSTFLTSNVRSSDAEVKETALKAFAKLFDNGHTALIRDVKEEELSLFLNKDPQYFIPWRLVFKDSVSTPCSSTTRASSSQSNGTSKGSSTGKIWIQTILFYKELSKP